MTEIFSLNFFLYSSGTDETLLSTLTHAHVSLCLSLCFLGTHILQMMTSCEWDDETGDTDGSEQFGYDGEDFIAFDLKTATWISPKPQAQMTKSRWDNNKRDKEYRKHYLTQECVEWLKKYLDYGKSLLQRTGGVMT